MTKGPLSGLKIIEIAGLGPTPFCAMLLADLGADVLRVENPSSTKSQDGEPPLILTRGRRRLGIDLKRPQGQDTVLRLVEEADALIEGFRPGVAERLGIGPVDCRARNPRLVYGRMTGWGQKGPLSERAGHDINYIAIAGVLGAVGEREGRPIPPLSLVGDFGGGGMLLAVGVLAAILEARLSGQGQVVDAAMVDGAALLTTAFHELMAANWWTDQRGTNSLDTGAHFYNTYETADGEYIAVGAIEPQFYAVLLSRLGVEDEDLRRRQTEKAMWPEFYERLSAIFRTRTRVEWCALLEDTDACVTPVLSMSEAPLHAHNRARGTFIDIGGVIQPAPAPRFSRTMPSIPLATAKLGQHTREALLEWGFAQESVDRLIGDRIVT